MQELLNIIVLLAILSCAFSFLLWPLTSSKKIDPFFLIRKLMKVALRLTLNILDAVAQGLGKLAKILKRHADHRRTAIPARIVCYALWGICLLGRGIVTTPAGLLKILK